MTAAPVGSDGTDGSDRTAGSDGSVSSVGSQRNGRVPFVAAGRLLRLELRHSTMLWMLPVAGTLFWVLAYRGSMALPPMWSVRAMNMQGLAVAVFIPTVVGAAAWAGAREARRGMGDLLGGTARARWTRQLATWAATTCWAAAGYLVCVGVLYWITARQGAWGGPLWWPAAVGAMSLPALSAFGFVAGAVRPSRFTPPLVAVAAFVGLEISLQCIHGARSLWQISPLVAGAWEVGPTQGVATFYRYLPDLSIAQLLFLAGCTAALLGALGLPSGAGGRVLRRAAAALTVAGLLAAGTAVALTGTARLDPNGMIAIPALHDAADDAPVPYTPVCSGAAIPVCLHPAYAMYLPAVATALEPVLSEVAGLPGAPVRVTQAAATVQQRSEQDVDVLVPHAVGAPGEYRILLPNQFPGVTMSIGASAAEVRRTVGRDIVARVIGDGTDPVQRAVETAVLRVTGVEPEERLGAEAQRFAAAPAAARHAWLVQHLAALRDGRLTLADLP